MPGAESVRALGMSLASTGLLVLCVEHSSGFPKTIVGALRWGSTTTLLFLVYYLGWCGWSRGAYCRRRERYSHASRDELEAELEETAHGREVQARVVLYPELTVGSVWVYVYGWGLLLFVCLYCLSGLETATSCWWVLGMSTMVFDELIQSGSPKLWVTLIGSSLLGSACALWMGDDGDSVESESFGEFLTGAAMPVVVPFIFFSARSRMQPVVRDVTRLCELAAPFMAVLSVCVLVGTAPPLSPARRALQNGTYIETPARFYATSIRADPEATRGKVVEYAAGLASPLAGAWALWSLIHAVLDNSSTEFITAFLFVLSGRFMATHELGTLSILSGGLAGLALGSVLLLRRAV